MKNTFVSHADTYMIRRQVIRITESIQAQLLKIFRRIGYVRSAVWEKMYLSRKIKYSM